jgi:hypothetical protein
MTRTCHDRISSYVMETEGWFRPPTSEACSRDVLIPDKYIRDFRDGTFVPCEDQISTAAALSKKPFQVILNDYDLQNLYLQLVLPCQPHVDFLGARVISREHY